METQIGTLEIDGDQIAVMRTTYSAGGAIAIQLYDLADGAPYTRLSVNPEKPIALGPDEFIAKTWSENEYVADAARASDLFEDTGRRVPMGFVTGEVWRILPCIAQAGASPSAGARHA